MIDINIIKKIMNGLVEKTLLPKEWSHRIKDIKNSRGLEKIFYPYFNRELLYHLSNNVIDLDKIVGIGSGRYTEEIKDNREADCLLILKNDERIGFELKIGTNKNWALKGGGTNRRLNRTLAELVGKDTGENIIEELSRIYGQSKRWDDGSTIWDAIKLIKLIQEGFLISGFAIYLLIPGVRNAFEHKDAYKRLLPQLLECIRPHLPSNLTYKIEDLNLAGTANTLSIIEVG